MNLAVGGEYFLSPAFSLLGGLSTNLSTLGGLAPTMTLGNLVQSRTNWANLSFGIGSYGSSADLLLGMQLGYGWGQELAREPLRLGRTTGPSWTPRATLPCSSSPARPTCARSGGRCRRWRTSSSPGNRTRRRPASSLRHPALDDLRKSVPCPTLRTRPSLHGGAEVALPEAVSPRIAGADRDGPVDFRWTSTARV